MSIRSIDAQIMVQRTVDFAKDASILQRHPQTAQENVAERNKAESVLDASRVKATEESEMEGIRADEDGGNAGTAGGGGSDNSEEEQLPDEENPELMVAPAAHEQIIDIMI